MQIVDVMFAIPGFTFFLKKEYYIYVSYGYMRFILESFWLFFLSFFKKPPHSYF